MTTFPVLGKADLDEEQTKLWDELTLGQRSVLTGGPSKKWSCPGSVDRLAS